MPAVERLVQAKVQESGILDYKSNSDRDANRKNLGKTASAFANSSGGVILWGILKQSGKVPSLQGVDDPEALVESLYGMQAECLSPAIPGVSHIAVSNNDKSVVVTYVPASVLAHQCCLEEFMCYFYRDGDRCRKLSDRMIRDMMLARRAPKLAISCTFESLRCKNAFYEYSFSVLVKNVGLELARSLAIGIEDQPTISVFEAKTPTAEGVNISTLDIAGRQTQSRVARLVEEVRLYPGEERVLAKCMMKALVETGPNGLPLSPIGSIRPRVFVLGEGVQSIFCEYVHFPQEMVSQSAYEAFQGWRRRQ